MKTIKKYKWLVVLALVVMTGVAFVSFLFYRDVRTLENFAAAYKNFDKIQSESALAELNIKAAVRISSATQNDPQLMSTMREIADIAAKELASLKKEKNGSAKDYQDLALQRRSAYIRFQTLSGIKD